MKIRNNPAYKYEGVKDSDRLTEEEWTEEAGMFYVTRYLDVTEVPPAVASYDAANPRNEVRVVDVVFLRRRSCLFLD